MPLLETGRLFFSHILNTVLLLETLLLLETWAIIRENTVCTVYLRYAGKKIAEFLGCRENNYNSYLTGGGGGGHSGVPGLHLVLNHADQTDKY